MINKVKQAYLGWKFKKHVEKHKFNMNVFIEVPEYEVLIYNIMEITPEPKVITIPDTLIPEMVKEDLAPSYMAMDKESMYTLLSNEGRVMIPFGILNTDILTVPGLNIILIGDEDPIPDEIQNGLYPIAKNHRMTAIEGPEEYMMISLNVSKQLWDMSALFGVFEANCGLDLSYTDQANCAGMTKRVRYQIAEDVRIVKANLNINEYGFHMKFL